MIKILLAGDGGQGIQLLSHIICESAFHKGLEVTHIPNYGLEQRGGVSLAFIKISKEKIVYPKFSKTDLLLVMSKQAEGRVKQYKDKKNFKFEIVNYKEFLEENNIPVESYNIFFLGLILKKLDEQGLTDINYAKKMLKEKLSTKSGWENNQKAFLLGRNK